MMNDRLIQCDKEPKDIVLKDFESVFFLTETVQKCFSWNNVQKNSLDFFIHQVSKKPTNLLSHLQRIYFCYHENLSEQLYASLLDFLLVLKGNGREISLRVFHGSKSRLSPKYRNELSRLFKGERDCVEDLEVSRYSLLGKGLIGSSDIITRTIEVNPSEELDELKLARDYIEYSQLEEARSVLEKAIKENRDNQEMHEELLSLYLSTEDVVNFQKMYAYVKQHDNFMLKMWKTFHTSMVESINEG